MRHSAVGTIIILVLGAALALPAGAQEILPFPPKPSGSMAGRTMQESIYSPLPAVKRLPEDAPNILIVLIDDVGPAQTATYGGEIHTPALDKIAKEGISYNRFHTTAMCSPTRAALLTGRNHHRVASGQITELANDWDGYMGTIPKSSATVAEVLKDYGYHTGAWGKWHNTPAEQTTAAGPFDYWPTGYGFEYFYGFLAGEASQYEPSLVRNTAYVEHPHTSGGHDYYHLSEDLADDAIVWLRQHKAFSPDKPFFMYWASGASHGPHQVPKQWADKYKGKFDDGWDKYRERAYQRAKQMGWIPQSAKLTPRPANLAVVGCDPRRREALPAPPDGGVRRLHRARGRSGRPHRRRDRPARLRREHPDPLHLGRQRRLGRRPGRHDQRTARAERHSFHHEAADRGARRSRRPSRARFAQDRQHVSRRLGLGRRGALPVHEVDCLALRRHPQPAGRALAREDQARCHAAGAVPARERRGSDDLRHRRHHPAAAWSTASPRTRSTASALPPPSPMPRPRK